MGGRRDMAPPAPGGQNQRSSRSSPLRSRLCREAGRGSPRARRLVRGKAAPRRAARPSAGLAGSAATAGAAREAPAAPPGPARRRRTATVRRKRDRRSAASAAAARSEEHTSELQSHLNLLCPLLLEKKNTNH